MVMVVGRWGTWEELLLGGAVLRHGTGNWNVVAAELRARSLFPDNFTSEACKAKYEDLQKRYPGRKAWFEELKKKRMAELRAALEQSEDSIGSLESKLESLKAEREGDCNDNYDSSRTISLEQCHKSEGVECSSKDTSKDLSSASSVTRHTQTNWSPEPKLEGSVQEQEKNLCIDKLVETPCGGHIVPSIRKRRGKRKRKVCSKDVKGVSVGESNLLGIASRCKETSTSNSGQIIRSCSTDDQSRGHGAVVSDDLMEIYNSITENECALVFRRRLDSQKRGRYKKLVRRHMDLDTIKRRIAYHSISSAKELFRDFFLVANNALVLYSRNTREYKSAMRLRDIVSKSLHQHLKKDNDGNPAVSTLSSTLTTRKPPARKPRSVRPPKAPIGKTAGNVHDVIKTPNGGKRMMGGDSPPLGLLQGRGELVAARGRKKARGR